MRNPLNSFKKTQTWQKKPVVGCLVGISEVRVFDSGSHIKDWVQIFTLTQVMHRALPWARFSSERRKSLQGGSGCKPHKNLKSFFKFFFSVTSLVSLISQENTVEVTSLTAWDSLYWECLAVKACKTGSNVNSIYINPWLFRSFRLLPSEIWPLLVWRGWEMPISKQLCLYFSEWFSVVI